MHAISALADPMELFTEACKEIYSGMVSLRWIFDSSGPGPNGEFPSNLVGAFCGRQKPAPMLKDIG